MSATTGDMPQITSSSYGSSSTAPMGLWPDSDLLEEAQAQWNPYARAHNALPAVLNLPTPQPTTDATMPNTTPRRLVQVFIADTDSNVPLESALLYKGEPQFTDSTDQELYFEIPVSALLGAHNEKRKGWLDKEATRKAGKDIFLEPAKIRDLKMVVVTIAAF